MTETELLNMKLHEEVTINDFIILRVVGGWIYRSFDVIGLTSTFVAERKE